MGRYCIIAHMKPCRSQNYLRIPALILFAVSLAGCAMVYKQDIQQGNVLDADDVAELNEGMTKRQVLVLLGSPSIQSPFHADRWDYMNTFAPQGGSMQTRLLTLRFENDRLVAMEGSYLDEDDVASQALDELQDDEARPIQDLETLQEDTEPTL